jgi:hypothetical protein
MEETTTIKVYKADREQLDGFGRPTHVAMRALMQKRCVHLESARIYMTALVDVPGKSKTTKRVSGFFCKSCAKYVFSEPELAAA